jgi:hypothetical protein
MDFLALSTFSTSCPISTPHRHFIKKSEFYILKTFINYPTASLTLIIARQFVLQFVTGKGPSILLKINPGRLLQLSAGF